MTQNLITRRGAMLGLAVTSAGICTSCLAAGTTLNDRLSGDLRMVHDPAVIKTGEGYYLFSTSMQRFDHPQIPWRFSSDMVHWTRGGDVLPHAPAWLQKEVPGLEAIWAPDVSFYAGKYWLYYTGSIGGKNTSAIGLLTNPTLDPKNPRFHWADEGMVFRSFKSDPYNAIDPNHIVDEAGNRWLAFGSFWSGLKLIALDKQSGKPSEKPVVIALASRGGGRSGLDNPIEAPFIRRHGKYYYLYAACDFCCRGARSSYFTVVGRSAKITGPYVDEKGTPMLNGGAKVLLAARKGRWHGQGGASVFSDGTQAYLVYHAYDAYRGGVATLRIAPLIWQGGWPEAVV